MLERYLEKHINNDLAKKMVFIGGPRQVGKTTLSKNIALGYNKTLYLNWDSRQDRMHFIEEKWSPELDVLIFDEIHKYETWKSHIKGIWDTRKNQEKIIVTGSSRLDIFRRGGDSLLGRYHYYRLHPLTLRELHYPKKKVKFTSNRLKLTFDKKGDYLKDLFDYGGFPEAFISKNKKDLKRWHNERFERIFREDIRDVENIQFLSKVELLGYLLPKRVGSPLSISSLINDIEATSTTIKNWIDILCRNYYIFKIPPYHHRLERAIKKEAKYYLWDWSEIEEEGIKFENLLALHLLKYCHFYHDTFGINLELFYLRDREKRETDFMVTWEKRPWIIVECKLNKPNSLTALNYFANKLNIDNRFCVTFSEKNDYLDKKTNTRIIPASKFLMALI